jgi:hypothetical protein
LQNHYAVLWKNTAQNMLLCRENGRPAWNMLFFQAAKHIVVLWGKIRSGGTDTFKKNLKYILRRAHFLFFFPNSLLPQQSHSPSSARPH